MRFTSDVSGKTGKMAGLFPANSNRRPFKEWLAGFWDERLEIRAGLAGLILLVFCFLIGAVGYGILPNLIRHFGW